MEEKENRIIVYIFIFILVIVSAFAVLNSFKDNNTAEQNFDDTPPHITAILDYYPNATYPAYDLVGIINTSDIIVKGTVTSVEISSGWDIAELRADTVLKGSKNIQTITIKNNYQPLDFNEGDEFVFFISEYDGTYYVITTQGYLKNTGVRYEGKRYHLTYDELLDVMTWPAEKNEKYILVSRSDTIAVGVAGDTVNLPESGSPYDGYIYALFPVEILLNLKENTSPNIDVMIGSSDDLINQYPGKSWIEKSETGIYFLHRDGENSYYSIWLPDDYVSLKDDWETDPLLDEYIDVCAAFEKYEW